MRLSILFIAILTVMFISACGKNLSTNQIQSRLIGTWDMDRVEFKDKGTLIKKDVSGNWNKFRLSFFNDGTLNWIDKSVSDTFPGYWYINEKLEWDANNQQNEVVQQLELYVYSADGVDYRYLLWEELSLTSSRFKAQESSVKGKYYYKLVKN